MGCDGGTIPRRDELVRQKKKPEQKDKNAENVAKWKHCAITQDPLRKPIVACELGKLYNKEAVIEHILNKSSIASSPVASHISKLSDVKELNLTEKSDFKQNGFKGDAYVDFNNSKYICPVTGLDMNGKQKFCFAWKCGCVFSERARKEVKSETCHKCSKPLDQNDIIIINGTDEEIEVLREKMIERRHLAKLEKKKKRSAATETSEVSVKKIKTESCESSSSEQTVVTTKSVNGVQSEVTANEKQNGNFVVPKTFVKKIKVEQGESSSSMSDLKSKNDVIAEKQKNKKSELKTNGSSSSKTIDNLPEKAKKNYSIAKDPNASAVYKSLFTSHHNAKKQEKAHWVTHNPLYY
ncbi:replication termination factor 2 [Caerostris extrusa]|uniref:Replication termination factor 2 n=1 Tax=Caerostris extrusa TaxID=172846 RepID=A0AAV4XCY9_CAEEX|nr:replication termination factor 2 [Caerostris extrusa]